MVGCTDMAAQQTWLSVFPGAAAGLHNTSVALRVPASAAPDYDSLPIEKTSGNSVPSSYAPAMSLSRDLHPICPEGIREKSTD